MRRATNAFHRTIIAVLAALPALAPVAAAAQVRDTRSTAGTGVISGIVVSDDADARPVRKARVTCGGADVRGHTTITDANGRFTFSGLRAGRYTIGVAKPTWVTTFHGAQRPARTGTPVPLADGEVRQIVVRLPRGAVITGVLLDYDNQPASGASVRALRYQMTNGERRLVEAGAATTDDRGVYRIFGLAAGDYFVSALARDTGGMTAGDLRLTSDADVREALAGTSRAAATPPRMVALAPGYYPSGASVSQASAVSLRAGEERTGVDFALQLVRTAPVEGSVTLPDGGVPDGAEIALIAATATALPALPADGYRRTHPGADGAFAFSGIPPGTYTLLARGTRPMTNLDGSPAPGQMVWASTQIAVDGEPVTGLSLSLEPGLTIAGRVRFADSPLTPLNPRSIRIGLRPADTQSVVSFAPAPVTASPDGSFRITGVVPGQYRMTASFPGSGRPGNWLLESITANGADALDAPMTILPNQHVLDALVTFTDRMGQLSGTVRAAMPAAYTVVLFPDDQRMWLPQTRRIQATRAAGDGAYAFAGIPAGTYRVGLSTDVEPEEWFDPAFLQRLVPASVRVVVQSTGTAVLDLRGLAPGERRSIRYGR